MKGYFKSQKCGVCKAVVMVRAVGRRVPATMCKALALADHMKTLHSDKLSRRGRPPGPEKASRPAAEWRIGWSAQQQAWIVFGPRGARGFFDTKAAAADEVRRLSGPGGRSTARAVNAPATDEEICDAVREAIDDANRRGDNWADAVDLALQAIGVTVDEAASREADPSGYGPVAVLAAGREIWQDDSRGGRISIVEAPRGNNPRGRFCMNPSGKQWAVIQWRGDGRYSRADAIKVYRIESAAQKFADRLNSSMAAATAGRPGAGYVVRQLPCDVCGLYEGHEIDCPHGRLRNRAGAKKRKAFRRSVMGKMGAYGRETKRMQRRGETLEAFRAEVAEGQTAACPLGLCRSKFTGQFERCAHSLGLKEAGVRVRAPKEAPAPWETLLPVLAKRNPRACRSGCACASCKGNAPRRGKEWRPAPTTPAARAAAQLEARLMREGRKIYPRVVAVAARKGWEKVTREHDFAAGPKLPIYGTANGSLLIPRGDYALWGSV